MLCINLLGDSINREHPIFDLSKISTNTETSYWRNFSDIDSTSVNSSECSIKNDGETEIMSDGLNSNKGNSNIESSEANTGMTMTRYIDEVTEATLDSKRASDSETATEYERLITSSESEKVFLNESMTSTAESSIITRCSEDFISTFSSYISTNGSLRRHKRIFEGSTSKISCAEPCKLSRIVDINSTEQFASCVHGDIYPLLDENIPQLISNSSSDISFQKANKMSVRVHGHHHQQQHHIPSISPPPPPLNPNPSRLMSLSEMTQMDVDSLNSVCGLVIPTNKGNSNVKREWRNVGWYRSEAAMNAVRKQQKVSKWKSVDQVNGLKVFFRCNKWKRTNCNYRMYVMYYAMDRISLNESGTHDHSTINPDYEEKKNTGTKAGTRVVVDTKPDVNQQVILDQFIRRATQNLASTSNTGQSSQIDCKQDDYFDHERLSSGSPYLDDANPKKRPRLNDDISLENGDCPYQLADNIGQLLQVATEIDLTFSFNPRRTMEFCFESNSSEMVGKRVVFGDLGSKIYVRERVNDVEQAYEEWKKADWKQFLWAVRGKCMNFFKLH